MATECCSHREDALPKELLQKCEPEVGHRVLTSRMKPFLEKYQESASPSVRDKQICSDLLKALEYTEKLQAPPPPPPTLPSTRLLPPIPTSRMTVRQDSPIGSERAASRQYTTSYQAAYKPTDSQLLPEIAKPLSPKRPPSNYPFGATYRISDPVGTSTYDREFNRSGDAADRRGTTIGESRNNPHPLESFMVWRFPRDNVPRYPAGQLQQTPKSPERFFPANEDVEQAYDYEPLRLSTYRLDYQKAADAAQAVRLSQRAGKPMSFFPDDGEVTRKVHDPPFTRNTTQRSSYHAFNDINQALRPTTTRYGSNTTKSLTYPGIAPTVSELRLQLSTRSHYDQEVSDRAVDVYEEVSTRTSIPRGRLVKRPPSTIVPEMSQ